MYWSAAQIVAHHASNGCNLQPGDLIGTGTLSTAEETASVRCWKSAGEARSRSPCRAVRIAASSRTETN